LGEGDANPSPTELVEQPEQPSPATGFA